MTGGMQHIGNYIPKKGSEDEMVLLAALERYPRESTEEQLAARLEHYSTMTPQQYEQHRAGVIMRLAPSRT